MQIKTPIPVAKKLSAGYIKKKQGKRMPPQLKHLTVEYLREKIVSGTWPPGHRLSDFALSREIGISRTPIREAISQLAAEGLVELFPHEGAFVRRLDLADILELYELREALECHCARKAAGLEERDSLLARMRRDLDAMRDLERALPAGAPFLSAADTETERRCDLDFHQSLIEAADNARIAKIVSEARLLARLFSLMEREMRSGILRSTIEFHRALLDAVERGDGDAAESAMRRHIRSGCEEFRAAHSGEAARPAAENIPKPLQRFL